MFFNCHSTKRAERERILELSYGEVEINPLAFHAESPKPIVWEEDTGKLYEHDIRDFLEVLNIMDRVGDFDWSGTRYYQRWKYKGDEVRTRLSRLYSLYKDIKTNGINTPVCCEITGERLDGSFRTKIAIHLGIKKVKARVYRFNWRDIDDSFIERKLAVREKSYGKDYYEFEYGKNNWKNVEGGEVYRENAERYKDIVPLITGKTVLDLGCNEGYIGLQAARAGKKVLGIDHEWTNVAYLNKLIFEYIDRKDFDIEFKENDLLKVKDKADTVLMLNVLYHLPREKQEEFVNRFKGSQMIFQCNLRKERERDNYYTSHPDDLKTLLNKLGLKVGKEIAWRDKPIIVV